MLEDAIGSRILKATAEKSKQQDIFRCGCVFNCARTNKVGRTFCPPFGSLECFILVIETIVVGETAGLDRKLDYVGQR